ncbi:MAG: hypothetical protein IKC85_03925, partial [Bacteroidaceae bacterium]|nr:hypothetical protein [Bacteroidaceae bacterium]
RGEITYSTDKHLAANLVTISAKRAKAVIDMNRRGERPENLSNNASEEKHSFDLLEQENINRFDGAGRKKHRKGNRNGGREQQGRGNNRHERRDGNKEKRGDSGTNDTPKQ